MKPTPPHWHQIYLSVGLTTLATLLLELSLTRIFSVVFYYHLAFMAISIALFGLGAGGVFSYVAGAWKGNLYLKLGRLSALNAALVVLALAVVVWQSHSSGSWHLAVIYFTTALPFFLSGTAHHLRDRGARGPRLLLRPRGSARNGVYLGVGTYVRNYPTRWGNVRASRVNEFNLGLYKNFKPTERTRLQFEAFNALNHPRFRRRIRTPGTATFGRVQPSEAE